MKPHRQSFFSLIIYALFAVFFTACSTNEELRTTELFNDGWLFKLGASTSASMVDYDDSQWAKVKLPHDWAIEGRLSPDNPSGAIGGALPGGIGWYRKKFSVSAADLRGSVRLQLDGAYMNTAVYVNGTLIGQRPNGYICQEYDITKYLHQGKNVIALRIDNGFQPNSRWYSGCGVYRNVWLTKSTLLYIPTHGVCVRTPLVNSNRADVVVETMIANESDDEHDVKLTTEIRNKQGKTVAVDTKVVRAEINAQRVVRQEIKISRPDIWDVDNPNLYTVVSTLSYRNKLLDVRKTTFGVRTFYFDAESGFILNDKRLKINGVCLHHDLSCLGAAVNRRAIERRLQMLKDMGCNAIRTAHNPPATEFLDLCDQMGIMVMDEAFDNWRRRKTVGDYSRFFDKWHVKDLTDMILRDRNHPSVILWSIGNSVGEQRTTTREDSLLRAGAIDEPQGVTLCRELADIVHSLDPTRPVTAASRDAEPTNNLLRSGALDIISVNFRNEYIDSIRKWHPGKPYLLAESASSLMTRGFYKMPSTETIIYPDTKHEVQKDPTYSCSSYDNCRVPWGSSHERSIIDVRDNDFVSGQFVWAGYDYLGEPTPYEWPVHASNFGIMDLAGFPKDIYYLYQSEWQNEKTVLHVFPHWNWKVGDDVDIWCYYNNADEVELYINGKSRGVQRKTDNVLHAMWRVAFEEGHVRVVSRKDGKVVAERFLNTAGRPARIRLIPDRTKLHADGQDVCYIAAEILDKDGNLCPNAENEITFTADGTVDIIGVDNGCPYDITPVRTNKKNAFYGKCMLVVRNNGSEGNMRIIAHSEGLRGAETTIHCLADNTY